MFQGFMGRGEEGVFVRKVNMKVDIIVEKTNTGYSAYADKYLVYTVGNSMEEINSNMLEALNLFFEVKSKTINKENLQFI